MNEGGEGGFVCVLCIYVCVSVCVCDARSFFPFFLPTTVVKQVVLDKFLFEEVVKDHLTFPLPAGEDHIGIAPRAISVCIKCVCVCVCTHVLARVCVWMHIFLWHMFRLVYIYACV